MALKTTFLACATAALLAVPIGITGCKKKQDDSAKPDESAKPEVPKPVVEKPAGPKANSEFSAQSVGLGPEVKSLGADPAGRYWFQSRDNKSEHWMFEPKNKTLFKATKDEATGDWNFQPRLDVTAESLGLGPKASYKFTDPMNRYWFDIGANDEQRVYDRKSKKLYRAVKDMAGKWKLTEVASPQK